MALYKPSNFYPDLTEVDFQDPNGAEFECKIHTNGSQVKAYKMNILSEDGIPLYESYHNLDSLLNDGDYLQAKINAFDIKTGGIGIDYQTLVADEPYIRRTHGYSSGMELKYQSVILKKDIGDIINYDGIIKCCPYNLYMVAKNNFVYFNVEITISGKKYQCKIKNAKSQRIMNDSGNSYDEIFWYIEYLGQTTPFSDFPSGFKETDIESINITLKNGYNYLWNIRTYEHYLENINEITRENSTFITEDNFVGTTDGVVLYNKEDIYATKNSYDNNVREISLSKKIQEKCFLDVFFDKQNSDFLKNKIIQGGILNGYLSYFNFDKCIWKIPLENVIKSTDSKYIIKKSSLSYSKESLNKIKKNDIIFGVFFSNTATTTLTETLNKNLNWSWIVLENNETEIIIEDDIKNLNLLIKKVPNDDSLIYLKNAEQTGLKAGLYWATHSTGYQADSAYIPGWFLGHNDNSSNYIFGEFNSKSPSALTRQTITGYMFVDFQNEDENDYSYYFSGEFQRGAISGFGSAWTYGEIKIEMGIAELQEKPTSLSSITINSIIKNLYSEVINNDAPSKYIKIQEEFSTSQKYGVLYFTITFNIKDTTNIAFSCGGIKSLDTSVSGASIALYNMVCIKQQKYLSQYDKSITLNYGNLTATSQDEYFLKIQDPFVSKENILKINSIEDILYKEKDYYVLNLENQTYQKKLIKLFEENMNNDFSIPYEIVYKQREKINQIQTLNGFEQDINCIILEEDLKYKLKNGEQVNLYTNDNEYTKNSLCVKQNEEIVVGRYIRFPSIDQKEYTKTNFPSYSSASYIPDFEIGENVLETSEGFSYLVNSEKKKTLHKILGYDVDTGEVRFENELEDSVSSIDTYEIWELTEVSGDPDNKYYTRRLPNYDNKEKILYVEGDPEVIIKSLSNHWDATNKNSCLFLKQNENIKSDIFYNPQIDIFHNKYNIIYIPPDSIFSEEKNWSINNILNTQAEIKTEERVDENYYEETYKIYSAFVDAIPNHYFYARDKISFEWKWGDLTVYNLCKNTIDFWNDQQYYSDFSNKEIIYCTKNIVLKGLIDNNSSIKRYKYQLFDMKYSNLLLESNWIYNDDLEIEIIGCHDEEEYLLIVEVETDTQYLYKEKLQFTTKYKWGDNPFIQEEPFSKISSTKNATEIIIASVRQGNFIDIYKKNEYGLDEYLIQEKDNTKNIIEQFYDKTKSYFGIQYTVKDDGVEISGIATNDSYFNIISSSNPQTLEIGEYYFTYLIKSGEILPDGCIVNLYYKKGSKKILLYSISSKTQQENEMPILNIKEEMTISIEINIKAKTAFSKATTIIPILCKKNDLIICDYKCRNNEIQSYEVLYKSINASTPIYSFINKINMESTKTCFDGYSLIDLNKEDNTIYSTGESWTLKYNLEQGDSTINLGVTQYETMGRYANTSYGKKRYESSTISCLLGDVEQDGYTEFDGRNNINKLLKWKNFITNGNIKLLKDYKGNMFLVNTVENPTYKVDTNSHNQVTTISFNWVEVKDINKVIIRDIITDLNIE